MWTVTDQELSGTNQEVWVKKYPAGKRDVSQISPWVIPCFKICLNNKLVKFKIKKKYKTKQEVTFQ